MRALIVALVLIPVSARAQGLPLAQVLPDLILREIVLESPPISGIVSGTEVPTGFTHTAHFSPLEGNDLKNPVVGIVNSFNSQMATQFSTFPLGSSSGGMTYVFDEALGTFRRNSVSFGPMFAERALTIGRRKLSIGFNYQYTNYDSLEGQPLDGGSIKFYLRHNDCCTVTSNVLTDQPNGTRLNPPFEGDVVEAALSLKTTTHTTALFANYGVTDRLDIGVAVPVVRVNLDASVTARIIRLVTGAPVLAVVLGPEERQAALNVHTFELNNPNATRTVRQTGHASGIGDVVLRTKYHVLRTADGGLASAVDIRLPTGDETQLLGAGGAQAKFLLIASDERGRFGEHVNIGYTVARGEVAGNLAGLRSASLPDEVNYSGGLDFVAGPRVTVNGDFVGRTLRNAGRLDVVSKGFQHRQFDQNGVALPSAMPATTFFNEFEPRSGNLTLWLGTAGAKWNFTGNMLLTGSVLFPLTDAGLRSRVTTVVGLDYAF
jgi:hypothetical protein